jgi:hypothetical protein
MGGLRRLAGWQVKVQTVVKVLRYERDVAAPQ